MIEQRLTPAETRSLLARMLAGVTEGDEGMWWQLIGPIEAVSPATDRACDWRVTPAGTAQEISTIEHAAGLLAAEHPHLRH